MTQDSTINLVQDGTTSVALDEKLIADATGLTVKSADNTVEPLDGFGVGFDISERSGFIFSENSGFRGEIEHTGTVTFSSDAGDITVGDFTIAFDAHRQTGHASGFFVENTVGEDLILFDVSKEIIETGLSNGDLLVSPEFASFLGKPELTGADVGDAAINAIIKEITDLHPVGIQDGTTSVTLDEELIADATGLTVKSADNTVEPLDGFAVGFDISEDSDILLSKNDFAPIAGEIEHTGTVTFSSDAGDITVGDFTIAFDAHRRTGHASGFFVENTVGEDLILFDVGIPDSLGVTDTELSLGRADLLVSEEFASFLGDPSLTGADVGDAAINGILNFDLL